QSPYSLFGIIVRKDSRTLLRSLMAFTPVAVLGGAEDIQLQSDDIIRPITIAESQMLAYVVKTYLDKLAYDQSRIRNPLENQRTVAVPIAAGPANNAGAAAATAALSAQATPASTVSPTNPFGLEPGQLDSFSSGQDDFSSVPADMQRANIVALLDVAAPGSP